MGPKNSKTTSSRQLQLYKIMQSHKSKDFLLKKIEGYKPLNSPKHQKQSQISQDAINAPPLNDNSEQKDFESDTRKHVPNTLTYPFSAIGCLIFLVNNQKFKGTAFLIEKNLGLTAAHNFFDTESEKQSEGFLFYPGANGASGSPYKIKKIYYPVEYKQKVKEINLIKKQYLQAHLQKNQLQKSNLEKKQQILKSQMKQFDYGVFQLEQNIGEQFGYFGADFQGKSFGKVEIYGYPGEVRSGSSTEPGKMRMYGQEGQCIKINNSEGRLQYTIFTSKGQSGSPVFKRDGENIVVIGIHTCAGDGAYNQGILLTEKRRTQINKWLNRITQFLDIRDKKITDKDLQITFQYEKLDISKIRFAMLYQNQITAEGMRYFIEHDWILLERLHLSANNISDQGVKYFTIKNWSILRHLQLDSINMSHKGAQIIGNHSWPCLQTLTLNGNNIGCQGAKSLSKNEWPKLGQILLNVSNIRNIGAQSLIDKSWTCLYRLSLIDNPVTEIYKNQKKNKKIKNIEGKQIQVQFWYY